ncbi:putative Type IV pilus minor pilin PilV [Candidatus Sulfobium mesophilum]|uniref:Putative Type IV pilus minor pilin PilV n=1 Tax=Candidatus Sulfobium mesophilum TaxID=2016548 RepID=A0A2U3QGV6_9BACT|nr:putative Type IV pilus minor pilin PilV [Candidatus Sulfobium mesophilum]
MRNNIGQRGFSLVEVMLALVILLFVSLALMQVALVTIDSNMTNTLRDEAVSIAEQRMTDLRSVAWSDAFLVVNNPAGADEAVIRRDFRLFSLDFTPHRTITALAGDVKQIDVRISWTWKNQTYTHTITSIVRQ